jgi:hypothetical protein
MSLQDLLNDLPEDKFPANVEGKCNVRMHGRDGYDRCANGAGHKGSHVSWQTKKRNAEKANPAKGAKERKLMRELAEKFGYKLTAQTPEAKAYEKAQAEVAETGEKVPEGSSAGE